MCLDTGDMLETHVELKGDLPTYEVDEVCDGPIPEPEEEPDV
jgi:hypothetical protein